MDDWKPIETAPTDGTPVIVVSAISKTVGEACYSEFGGGWLWGESDKTVIPSHWMPMPEPPDL